MDEHDARLMGQDADVQVDVITLHLNEARGFAPDDIAVRDLVPIANILGEKLQQHPLWEQLIEESVQEYLAD